VRIAFLCTSGLDNASPRGRWLPIAREMAKRGHEMHLLLLHPTFDRIGSNERGFALEGVHIAYVGQMHVYGLPGQRRFFDSAELATISLHSAAALARQAIRLKPDILHICKPQPINGLSGWLASRALNRPFYIDCDDYEAEANRVDSEIQRSVIRWWEEHLPRHAAGVTVNTRFLLERCRSLGVTESHIACVPNGANAVKDTCWGDLPAPLQALSGQPVVIYVGTLSTVAHSVDLLLDAFALVLQQMSSARLLMVGDGDDREVLRSQVQRLGIASAVHWVGRVLPEDTPRYFALATCSVDPVRDTPAARGRSPLKIAESLVAGVPVVTGNVGDRREMLADGQAGVLVKAGDASALAEGLMRALCDEALAVKMRRCAREHSQNYAWSRLAERWMSIYR
jgi:glycosyltransferase involved in cell wall biosynthesis